MALRIILGVASGGGFADYVHSTKDDSHRKKLIRISRRIDRLIDKYTLM